MCSPRGRAPGSTGDAPPIGADAISLNNATGVRDVGGASVVSQTPAATFAAVTNAIVRTITSFAVLLVVVASHPPLPPGEGGRWSCSSVDWIRFA